MSRLFSPCPLPKKTGAQSFKRHKLFGAMRLASKQEMRGTWLLALRSGVDEWRRRLSVKGFPFQSTKKTLKTWPMPKVVPKSILAALVVHAGFLFASPNLSDSPSKTPEGVMVRLQKEPPPPAVKPAPVPPKPKPKQAKAPPPKPQAPPKPEAAKPEPRVKKVAKPLPPPKTERSSPTPKAPPQSTAPDQEPTPPQKQESPPPAPNPEPPPSAPTPRQKSGAGTVPLEHQPGREDSPGHEDGDPKAAPRKNFNPKAPYTPGPKKPGRQKEPITSKKPLSKPPIPKGSPGTNPGPARKGVPNGDPKGQWTNASRGSYLSGLKSAIENNKQYPSIAEREGMEGEVMLSLTVSPDGSLKISLIKSSGYPLLDEAALSAAREVGRYKPYAKDMKPEPITETLRVRFFIQ